MLVSRTAILAAFFAASVSYLIDPRLLYGALILYVVNVLVSFWLEAETDGAYRQTARASTVRACAYGLVGTMAITANWMMRGIPGMLKAIFGFIAGIEFLVGFFKLARITPRLRPLWTWSVQRLDEWSPVSVTTEQIESFAQTSSSDEKSAA